MSPREAQQTDPMQRLAIVTAYEALERAGYVANRTASADLHRISTFYGQASDDHREVNTAYEIGTYFIPGCCRAFGPGRINYFFKFSGPSYSIDTACSSNTDMAVAGGMNVLTNSDAFAGLSNGHFLSKTPKACKTWDSEADGYCRADGVGSIVMKRLEDAEADNDNILGVILAAATNHSAEAVSITHLHAGHQAYLGRQIMNRAGIDPLDVSFVEMHGTGTQAGDAGDPVCDQRLGEYAALHIAGVLSASDTVFLVGQRALMLEQKCTVGNHKMVAVRASLAQIQEAAGDKPFEVASINGPKHTVLAGSGDDMAAIIPVLEAASYKCFSLDVAFAFQSAQTDPIFEEFEAIATSGVLFQAPQIPVVSPLLGKGIFDDKSVNASYVSRSTRETVNFLGALEFAHKIGTVNNETAWIEIGPHPVCIGFVRSALSTINVATPSLRRDDDNWMTMAKSLAALHCAGVKVDWNEFHRPFESALRLLDLPTYAWNDKKYWIQYNGDWALTKGNTFYDAEKGIDKQIIDQSFEGAAGIVVVQPDLMQPDFRNAAWEHQMNGCDVVTFSIHADISYTLGEYLYKKLCPSTKKLPCMNIANLQVLKGLVANKNTDVPQLLRVSIATSDIDSNVAELKCVDEPFASATLIYGQASEWLNSWVPMACLIKGRIQDLERLAETGAANRFTNKMAYLLFANSRVDYAIKYRGMRSVVMNGLEAFADVEFTIVKGDSWTVPPYFIDSVAHLAGFVMNMSDANDTKNNFCVTPGWRSMRFAGPLVAGGRCRSYVKMIPAADDPHHLLRRRLRHAGRRGRRHGRRYRVPPLPPHPTQPLLLRPRRFQGPAPCCCCHCQRWCQGRGPQAGRAPVPAPAPAIVDVGSGTTTAKAMQIIVAEAALPMEELTDDASFANPGVDSLMSLVIAEKFRESLGVVVGGPSLFLEYPTIGDLRSWLEEYYN
ncbi:hypothetical protein F4809DRAFT_637216 [Biscogniauxia mediterranea]|nr:hypothetical protein F4809DRAFT_637216 [Biscogniauxia mediterranea]